MVGARLGVVVERERVIVAAVRRGRATWAAEAVTGGPAELAAALSSLAAERPRGVRRARVALSEELAPTRLVAGVPRLSAEDLAAHVRLHSRRYFLQNGIPLVTDATPAAGGARMSATELPLLEAVHRGLQAAGISCESVAPAAVLSTCCGLDAAVAAARTSRPLLRFETEALVAARRAGHRRRARWWIGAAAMAVATAVVLQFAAPSAQARRARRELAAMGHGPEQAAQVMRDLYAATAALDALSSAERHAVRHARFMADLVRTLGDSTFLAGATFEAASVRLVGYAPSASALVARLERLPSVIAARLDGAVAREVVAGRERERFTIVAELRPSASAP
jgi:hypothetical protein